VPLQSVTQLRYPYPSPLLMPRPTDETDERQIRAALELANLSYVEALNPDLPRQLAIWLRMLLASVRNLTAIREPGPAIRKHVIEPLAGRDRLINADLPLPHGPMIDIGSGNGAPGLPVALCEPQRSATLLDSRSAATEFLRNVVTEIDAAQIQIRQDRAEIAAHTDLRSRFALAVSRAAAPPLSALELAIPFLQIGGIGAIWTGELAEPQLDAVARAVAELGAEFTPIDQPQGIVVVTKVRATNPRYPRSWQQMRRRPLSELARADDDGSWLRVS